MPVDRVELRHAAASAARAMASAEEVLWETPRRDRPRVSARVAMRTQLAETGDVAPEEGAEEAFDYALMLRNSIKEAGIEVYTPARVDVAAVRVEEVTDEGFDARVRVTREWTELDPGNGNTTDVSMESYYQMSFVDSGDQMAMTEATPEAEGAATADNGESLMDGEVVPNPSPNDESGVDAPQAGSPSEDDDGSTYDPSVFARYLRQNTVEAAMPSGFPSFENNCANFISQAYHVSGWYLATGFVPTNLSNWDYDLLGPAGPSRTWSQAKSLYRWARDTKGLGHLGNIWNARPGATYFMDWDGNEVINHVVGVSGRTDKGIPRISGKTSNRHNMLLTTWKAIVDDAHPNVKWYGVKRT